MRLLLNLSVVSWQMLTLCLSIYILYTETNSISPSNFLNRQPGSSASLGGVSLPGLSPVIRRSITQNTVIYCFNIDLIKNNNFHCDFDLTGVAQCATANFGAIGPGGNGIIVQQTNKSVTRTHTSLLLSAGLLRRNSKTIL